MAAKGKRRGPTAAEKRRLASARAIGLQSAFEKAQFDAMNERSLERFGMGLGALLEAQRRFLNEAAVHAAERAALPRRRRLYWPVGEWHRLRRMEAEARAAASDWDRRQRMVALDVAKMVDDATVQQGLSDVAKRAGER